MTLVGKILRQVRGVKPSPVAARLSDGTWIGHDGSAWLYMVLPLVPLHWEDQSALDQYARKLHAMLVELGGHSKASPMPGMKLGATYREFHMLALAWDELPECPPGIEPGVQEWLDDVFDNTFATGAALFCVGVRLRQASPLTATGFIGTLRSMISETMSKVPDKNEYAGDRALIGPILARAGGGLPTDAEAARIETWWNAGRGADSTIVVDPDGGSISCDMWPEGLEFSVLMDYTRVQLDPEHGLWLADAIAHENGCVAVSVRGELVPARTAREEFRKSRRSAMRRIDEQARTGDLDREEDSRLLMVSEMLESLFVDGDEPLVRNCSTVFARRATAVEDTFNDMLEGAWGVKSKVLEHRQMEGLEETLPMGRPRVGSSKVFTQDVTVGMLAASGLGAFNTVGDDEGIWMGTAPPDHSLVWLDPQGASKQNKPPCFGVVGEPGAGKTFLLQLIATQCALAGLPVVFINPKAADSLVEFADAVDGETIKVSALEEEPGSLDPFRYANPKVAAEIATAHINTAMESLTAEQRIYVKGGIKDAAANGARCVGEALENADIPEEARRQILMHARSDTLFGLGISTRERPPMRLSAKGRLTLIEFDREINIPPGAVSTAQMDPDERVAVAAVRLICRCALEQMYAGDGGVLILDEAHVFLSSQEGRRILQSIGRTGRSQGILPIMATQRLADLIDEGVDMSSYMSRVLAMQMIDPREADAALTLCGLEPTEARRRWLADAGPKHNKDDPSLSRGAFGLFRDLNQRVSAVLIGPVPEHVRMRFSTNLLDRAQRKLAQLAEQDEMPDENEERGALALRGHASKV